MPNVTAIVVQLDNGKYRSVRLSKVKSIYTDPAYRCQGTMEEGDGGALGPEQDKPDFSPQLPSDGATTTRGGNGNGNGNGDGLTCYLVNGVIVCL